jgi:5-methylthioadenosine/S-adenosylhomocysteine deaminase
MTNLILKDCDILTKEKGRWVLKPNASVIIKNEYIDKISFNKVSFKNYQVLDCRDKIIMPGLCNTHLHLGDTIFRGIINNVTLNEYLEKTEKYNEKFDDFSRRKISAQLTLLDSIRNGITSCCVGRGWPLLKEIDFFGMNILTGYVLMDIKRLREDYEDLEKKFFVYKKEMEKFSSNLKVAIFIHSLDLISKNLLKKIKQVVSKEKIRLIVHVGEIIKKNKKSDLELLSEYGLISKNTILVHCVNLSKNDYRILKKFRPNVVLCPTSNLKLLSGVADFKKVLETDSNICIATDGGATNNSFNLFTEIKLASLLYSYFTKKFILTENELLDFIITSPLKALGFKKTGLIKEGYRADLIMIDKNFIGIQPKRSIINNLIFSGDSNMIKGVIIGGKLIINERNFLNGVRIKRTINLFNKLCDKL